MNKKKPKRLAYMSLISKTSQNKKIWRNSYIINPTVAINAVKKNSFSLVSLLINIYSKDRMGIPAKLVIV